MTPLTLGRFPRGTDQTADRIVPDLTRADYIAYSKADIRRWKAARLTHNVRNVLELFDGAETDRNAISAAIVDEARLVLEAAGYSLASPSERKVRIANWRIAENSGIEPVQQSTWQSFTRGASSEVDCLNGEIVLLGRLHGGATPCNQAAQHIAGQAAEDGAFLKTLSLGKLRHLVDIAPGTTISSSINAA